MGSMLSGCGAAAPRGAESDVLVYCSYSATHHGGLGKDYCELIADPGQNSRHFLHMSYSSVRGTTWTPAK